MDTTSGQMKRKNLFRNNQWQTLASDCLQFPLQSQHLPAQTSITGEDVFTMCVGT